MEKIILKPVAKEFLHKDSEPGVAFDAFSYRGGTNQEKKLGALSLVGHIKYGEEDMSYLISLVSSLAKHFLTLTPRMKVFFISVVPVALTHRQCLTCKCQIYRQVTVPWR